MKTAVLLFTSIFLTASGAFAESTVSGNVVDPQGKAVPDATVRLHTAAGYGLIATADGEGRYQFASVPNGDYQLAAEAPGLTSVRQKLTLTGETAEHNVTLSQFTA